MDRRGERRRRRRAVRNAPGTQHSVQLIRQATYTGHTTAEPSS
ncbi:hypothetical protein [Streptomyces sp. NPDC048436]